MDNKFLNLNELEKSKSGNIVWKSAINKTINVLYNDIIYDFYIYDYKDCIIYFLYDDGNFKMRIQHFKNLSFKDVLEKKTYVHKEINNTNFEIDYEKNYKEFGYDTDFINRISHGSDIKLYFKCKKCNNTKNIATTFYDLTRKNRKIQKCEFCDGGMSYPERLFYSIIKQTNLNCCKKTFKWSNRKQYDAYFKDHNIICELHGNQHYEEGFSRIKSNKKVRTLKEEQENDKFKEDIALNNGINKYIVIDCRNSNFDFIKNNIINSELSNIINFDNIDWSLVKIDSEKSLLLEVCKAWNELLLEDRLPSNLSKLFGLSDDTIRNYIKIGHDLNLCEYDKNQSIENKGKLITKNKTIKFKCVFNGETYILNGYKEIVDMFGIKDTLINKLINSGQPYICKNNNRYKNHSKLNGLTISYN